MMRIAAALVLASVVALTPAVSLAQPPAQEPAAEKGEAARGAVVNLNTATAAQLESLPGIGPRAAERILEYRQKNGGFKKIEDLMNVKGIGEKSFLKLKPRITVTPPKA
jgi:competence protein ComEA